MSTIVIYKKKRKVPLLPTDKYNKGVSWSKGFEPTSVILEARVRAKVNEILKKYGAWFFAPVNFGFGKDGVPDNIFCLNGRFGCIESKGNKTGHILMNEQKSCLEEIERKGGFTYVANPFNLDALDDAIRGIYENKFS